MRGRNAPGRAAPAAAARRLRSLAVVGSVLALAATLGGVAVLAVLPALRDVRAAVSGSPPPSGAYLPGGRDLLDADTAATAVFDVHRYVAKRAAVLSVAVSPKAWIVFDVLRGSGIERFRWRVLDRTLERTRVDLVGRRADAGRAAFSLERFDPHALTRASRTARRLVPGGRIVSLRLSRERGGRLAWVAVVDRGGPSVSVDLTPTGRRGRMRR